MGTLKEYLLNMYCMLYGTSVIKTHGLLTSLPSLILNSSITLMLMPARGPFSKNNKTVSWLSMVTSNPDLIKLDK